MAFDVQIEQWKTPSGNDTSVYVLAETGRRAWAEVWPALGFNCFSWQVARQGQTHDLLYADPQLFANPVPTRSGIPILFPFPNRIRDGRFTWEGKSYQLPIGDPQKKNAIHGFVCRRPWRVTGQGADDHSAWLTGEFRGSADAPETVPLWPADYLLRVTYRLGESSLHIEAEVSNPDRSPLPFGLGYHPYFRVAGDARVQVPAEHYWELTDNLPTGERPPVEGRRDLRQPRPFAELKLDDALTDLPAGDPREVGRLAGKAGELAISASADFRELVVFTPPHRHAVCLEPYTCITDAVNLQERGVDAGWQVLGPGEKWTGSIEMTFSER